MIVRLVEGPRVKVQTRKRVRQKKPTFPLERSESRDPEN
jgi:hypothetical protein